MFFSSIKIDIIIFYLDTQSSTLKIIFISLFGLILSIYKDESAFWTELKFEAHLNSLLTQLIELSSQLPENDHSEVIQATKKQNIHFDPALYKTALENLEYCSISKTGSDMSCGDA